MLLKFLFILILAIYVFYRVAGFLFRLVFGSLRSDPGRFQNEYRQHKKRAPGSNLNIDQVPQPKSKSKKTGYDGGEYVDYEEVK